MDYCIKAKVKGIICFGIGMTLREGNREYYYEQLDKHFPGLKERYMWQYGNCYEVNSVNHAYLMRLIEDTCIKHDILFGPEKVFEYMKTFEEKQYQQLSLNL